MKQKKYPNRCSNIGRSSCSVAALWKGKGKHAEAADNFPSHSTHRHLPGRIEVVFLMVGHRVER